MFYFNDEVQQEIKNQLRLIRGNENKDDARQEAYSAIADEEPVSLEDAIACARRAIDRYRKRIIKIAKKEINFSTVEAEKADQQTPWGRLGLDPTSDDLEEYGDTSGLSPIDLLFLGTEECPAKGPAYYREAIEFKDHLMGPHETYLENKKLENDKNDFLARLRSGSYVENHGYHAKPKSTRI
jgi:hypothetical protein